MNYSKPGSSPSGASLMERQTETLIDVYQEVAKQSFQTLSRVYQKVAQQ